MIFTVNLVNQLMQAKQNTYNKILKESGVCL